MGLEEQVAALSARVDELERRLVSLDDPSAIPVLTPPPPRPPAPVPPPVGEPSAPVAPTSPAPAPDPVATPGREFVRPAWMTTETMLKWAGLGLVVLAAVFFVGTAISRGWIGPEIQLAGATAGGLALVAGGFRLIDRNRPWAAALASGGVVVVAICAAAANAGLDLIGEYPALVALAVVTVAAAWVSLRLSLESVAAGAGVAAALLPPWIADDADLPALVLAGWMTVLVLAATGLGWRRGWNGSRLVSVGFGALVLLVLAIAGDELPTGQKAVALAAVGVISLVAWAGPAYASVTKREVSETWRAVDHRFVLSIPLWTWAITALVVDFETDRPVAVFGLALAAAFALLVAATWSRLPRTLATAHVLGIGILVAVSAAVLTDGPGLLVALAVQAAATAIVARMFDDRWLLGFASVLGAIAVGWAGQSTLAGLFDELGLGQLLANLVVVALLAVWAAWSWSRAGDQLTVPLTLVAWVAVLAWIASAFGHQPQGQVVVSLLWTMLAAGALVIGVRSGVHFSRILGIVTLVVVLFKLLTVDLAEVDTLWRVGLFLVVGTGLLRLGYVLPRLSTPEDSPLR